MILSIASLRLSTSEPSMFLLCLFDRLTTSPMSLSAGSDHESKSKESHRRLNIKMIARKIARAQRFRVLEKCVRTLYILFCFVDALQQ